jgi:beta-galactosidase GanA
MLHRNGLKAILATPSGSRPPWMAQKYPSVLRMDNERKPYVYGARHNACYSSPDFRRKVTEMNTRLAQRYGNHPALHMWHVSNEYNYDCHCPRCQKAFRDWLRKRYGTIDSLIVNTDTVFMHLERIDLSAELAKRLLNGARSRIAKEDGDYRVYYKDKFYAIANVTEKKMSVVKLFVEKEKEII